MRTITRTNRHHPIPKLIPLHNHLQLPTKQAIIKLIRNTQRRNINPNNPLKILPRPIQNRNVPPRRNIRQLPSPRVIPLTHRILRTHIATKRLVVSKHLCEGSSRSRRSRLLTNQPRSIHVQECRRQDEQRGPSDGNRFTHMRKPTREAFRRSDRNLV